MVLVHSDDTGRTIQRIPVEYAFFVGCELYGTSFGFTAVSILTLVIK